MKVSELINWEALTPKEKARLKEVYNVQGEELPEIITKTMANPEPKEDKQNAEN